MTALIFDHSVTTYSTGTHVTCEEPYPLCKFLMAKQLIYWTNVLHPNSFETQFSGGVYAQ